MSYAPFQDLFTSTAFYSIHDEGISLRTFKHFIAGRPWQCLASDHSQLFSTDPTAWDETEACFAPMHVLPRCARAIIWPAGQIGPISGGHIYMAEVTEQPVGCRDSHLTIHLILHLSFPALLSLSPIFAPWAKDSSAKRLKTSLCLKLCFLGNPR